MKILCWTTLAARFTSRLGVALFLLIPGFALVSCGEVPLEAIQLSGATMGTSYNITIAGQSQPAIDPSDITQALEDIENAMSTYRPDSELMQFNDAPVNTWIMLSEPLFEVLEISQDISQLSDGAFDITVGPLVNLWGFGPVEMPIDALPNKEEVSARLKTIGYNKLMLAEERFAAIKHHAISLDLSAVAKGYAVDVLAELLEEQGIENYLVEIGGEVRTKGLSPRGVLWRIAIESPQLERGSPQRAIEVADIGMATSGDYRNYFETAGVRYSHTIDPRTGRPIEHRLASVTVMSATTARADAWATAFLVQGAEEGLLMANQHNIAAYFLVKSETGFEEIYSSAFMPFMSKKEAVR